jgi:hypothetical protein
MNLYRSSHFASRLVGTLLCNLKQVEPAPSAKAKALTLIGHCYACWWAVMSLPKVWTDWRLTFLSHFPGCFFYELGLNFFLDDLFLDEYQRLGYQSHVTIGEFQSIKVIEINSISIQFESIVNWLQMRSTRMVDTRKYIVVEEFQYSGKFQSIEVMKMKMISIHFESIVNLIQITSMKVTSNRKIMMIQQRQGSG